MFTRMLLALFVASTVSAHPTYIAELPQRPDPLAYRTLRSELLAVQNASDFQSDAPPLSDRERLANERLMAAKPQAIALAAEQRHFFDARDTLRNTTLFRLIERMPKGGILHAHDTAMAGIEYLVSVTYLEHLWQCYDASGSRISAFRFAGERPSNDSASTPCPKGWTRTSEERARLGARLFDRFMRSHFTLRTGHPFANGDEVWTTLESIFGLVAPLLTFEPVWRDYFRRALQEAHDDHVQYVEFRGVLPALYELDGRSIADPVEIVRRYVEVRAEFRRTHPRFIDTKFVYAPPRAVPDATIVEYGRIVRRLREAYPDFVVGFDLVGQEDKGRTLYSIIEWLLQMPESVPFYFHAGETNLFGSPIDENLYDAVLLGTRRIGHGFALAKHPDLMELVKINDIAVEICPISNHILRYIDDIRNHPATTYFSQNVPLIVSSDDPAYWEAKPLSDDFYQAFVSLVRATGDLRTLRKLATNSIRYSAMNASEQSDALIKWQAEWDQFIEDVIADRIV